MSRGPEGRFDAKAEVRAVVEAYLRAQHPERLAELDDVFDVVFAALPPELEVAPIPEDTADPREGLPFDSSFADGALLATTIWAAASFVQAMRGSKAQAATAERLDRLVTAFEAAMGDPETVRGVRAEVEARDNFEPDFRLVVDGDVRDGLRTLSFALMAREPQLEPILRPYGTTVLEKAPDGGLEGLLREIEKLGREDATAARRRLRGLGGRLASTLLPEPLRHRLRSLAGVHGVQVLSEEGWIPWELLWLPTVEAGAGEGGDFLGERFALARWFRARTEVLALPARSIAVLTPDDAPAGAAREAAGLGKIAGPDRSVTPIEPGYVAATDALRSGLFDAFHFAGHGWARGDDPEAWHLRVGRGAKLDAADLPLGSLAARRPLVFLNACRSGRGGLGLTGVGGLARAFVDAGAGAVVACHWAVEDEAAASFAASFYGHFFAGSTLGEAARLARLDLRDASTADPTWLAYTVFGHPNARCLG